MFDSSEIQFFLLCTYKNIDKNEIQTGNIFENIYMKDKELISLCKEHVQINVI